MRKLVLAMCWAVAEALRLTRRYLIRDNLADGLASSILSSPSYEAFGAQADSTRFKASADVANMTRGYTDHEQFDDLGIIHMNGRIYDADLGRFLSADPLVPHPYFSQSYNRYSYVMNNPLSLTDPSGFVDMPPLAGDDDCRQFGRPQPEPERGCLIAGTCTMTSSPNETPALGKVVTYQTYPNRQDLHYRYQGAMAVRDQDRSNDLGRYNGLSNAAENTWTQNTPAAVAPDVVASGEVGLNLGRENTVTAYVGGAMDDWGHHTVEDIASDKQAIYFSWGQREQLEKWIDDNRGKNIIVIGHSYGGDTAAQAVANGHRVTLLITVDPVSRLKPDYKKVQENSGIWINYDSDQDEETSLWNWIVTGIGGRWDDGPKDYADIHRKTKLDHMRACSEAYCQ